MKVTLLGFTLPKSDIDEILRTDKIMPIQTHKFAWSIVRGLSLAGNEVSLISSHPVSNYPVNKRLWFSGAAFEENGVNGIALTFINFLFLKHISRFFSCCTRGLKELIRFKPEMLLIHGVHSPFLIFGVLLHFFSRIKVVVILTDPPGVILPSDGLIVRILKRFDIALVRLALSSVDGVVALTHSLADDFAPGAPNLLLEGIIDQDVEKLARQQLRLVDAPNSNVNLALMYAGGMNKAYGVDRLVEAVKLIELPNITLDLFGRGDLDDWIIQQSKFDERIRFHGFVSQSDLLRNIISATVLVNPRPIDQEFVHYSFPSKLLEYMAVGVPVVTTKLPGIPCQYSEYLFFFENDDVASINSHIFELFICSAEILRSKARCAQEFVLNSRTESAQGQRLSHFLNGLL